MTQHINVWQRYGIGPRHSARLRFGLLLDDTQVAAWQAECIRLLLDSGLADLELVVLPLRPAARGRSRADLLRHAAYYAARATVWRTKETRRSPLDLRWSRARTVHALTRPMRGRWQAFDADSVAAVRAANLDFLLRFGFDLISGEILEAARFGVWSFHHGDERRYRGRPAAFWELHDGARQIGVVLQRLNERLDAGSVLRRGLVAVDAASYGRTLDRAYAVGVDFPLQVCRDILAGQADFPGPQTSRTTARVRTLPGTLPVLRTAVRIGWAAVKRGAYGTFVLKIWSIGWLDGGPAQLLRGETGATRWLAPRGRSSFLADPVLIPGHGGRVVLAESLRYSSGVGAIARVEPVDGPPLRAIVSPLIRQRGVHLSYPSLVRLPDGNLLCVPEAASTGSVVGYRLNANADRVLGRRTLVAGLAALDPTIFRHGESWWLACTERGPTSLSHLWLYFGRSPEGPWTAHARNPVVMDSSRARPAGPPFEVDGALYRPAQDSTAGYGGAVTITRITRLTGSEFAEELVARLEPDADGPMPGGLHTVSVDGDAVVIDGYRNVFHPLAWLFRLRVRLATR